MKKQPKHEKVIIPKGRIALFKKVISSLKTSDPKFKKLMAGLPPIQKLPTLCGYRSVQDGRHRTILPKIRRAVFFGRRMGATLDRGGGCVLFQKGRFQ